MMKVITKRALLGSLLALMLIGAASSNAWADNDSEAFKNEDSAGGARKEMHLRRMVQTDTYKQSGGGAPKERTVAPAGHGLRLIVGDVYKPSPDNGLEKK